MATRRAAPPAPASEPDAPKGQDAPPAPVVEPVARICENCLFWAGIPPDPAKPGGYISRDLEGAFGMCRRQPPAAPQVFNSIIEIGPYKVARAVWPLTYAGENCGAWEPANA